jgi:hypothetical protein
LWRITRSRCLSVREPVAATTRSSHRTAGFESGNSARCCGREISAGFVVCYIPESPYRPHRAEYAGRNYFIRAGDDFVIPSVSLLRALLHPHARPVVTPIVQGEIHKQGEFEKHTIQVWFANRGTTSAYDAYVIVDYQPSQALIGFSKDWEVIAHRPFHGMYSKPIHPHQRFVGAELTYAAGKSDRHDFTIRTYAKDMEAMVWRAELSLKYLERKVDRVAELQEPTEN